MTSRIDRMSLARFAQRSALLSISILTLDLIIYAGMVYGAIAAEAIWLKLLFSFGAGTMIALSAIAGHDAGHQSFSGNKRVNRFFGTIAFLPALHPFCLWEHHHNRVHHRFTAQLGVDNSFPPMTVDQYRSASPWRRARYQFMRSLWGHPFFYLIEVWLPDMWLPFLKKSPAMTPRTWFDLLVVYFYALAFIAGCAFVSSGVSGIIFGFAIPFLVWNAFISFLSIVQHTGPDVRWIPASGQPSSVEQAMAGTVHIVFPEWLDRLLHRIMQHQAHHIHVGIPLQRLKAAQAEVAAANDKKLVRVWTPAYHWRLARECKLYDPLHNRWCGFEAADVVPMKRAA